MALENTEVQRRCQRILVDLLDCCWVCEDLVSDLSPVSIKFLVQKVRKECESFINLEFVTDKENVNVNVNTNTETVDDLLKSIDLVLTYVWEQFNIGHWKSVPIVWRKLYTFGCLLKIILLSATTPFDLLSVIQQCDLGLLSGEPLLNSILSRIATNASYLVNQSVPEDILKIDAQELEIEEPQLPNQSPNCFQIQVVHKPSMDFFAAQMHRQEPLALTGIIDHWPASSKWNLEYILKIGGCRTVPVEIGSKYTSAEWSQKLMTISEFISKYMKSDAVEVGYVAQHDLLSQIPQLLEDINTPEYCYLGQNESCDINAWFGPAKTISPTHYDPKHNLLAQVFGQKQIRLFPPSESKTLCPHPADSLMFNTSQLDVESPRLFTESPEMKNVKYCDVILKAGQVLYMPPKWWHYVKSLSPSFSVSFWFE